MAEKQIVHYAGNPGEGQSKRQATPGRGVQVKVGLLPKRLDNGPSFVSSEKFDLVLRQMCDKAIVTAFICKI